MNNNQDAMFSTNTSTDLKDWRRKESAAVSFNIYIYDFVFLLEILIFLNNHVVL